MAKETSENRIRRLPQQHVPREAKTEIRISKETYIHMAKETYMKMTKKTSKNRIRRLPQQHTPRDIKKDIYMSKETYICEDGKRDLQKQDQASAAATHAMRRGPPR